LNVGHAKSKRQDQGALIKDQSERPKRIPKRRRSKVSSTTGHYSTM